MKRRTFLRSIAASTAAFSLAEQSSHAAPSVNDKITICVTGVRGRGGSLLETFAALPEVTVKYVCDLDAQVLASRVAQVESKTGKKPEAIKDFRTALDDKSVDALVLGTPDHIGMLCQQFMPARPAKTSTSRSRTAITFWKG